MTAELADVLIHAAHLDDVADLLSLKERGQLGCMLPHLPLATATGETMSGFLAAFLHARVRIESCYPVAIGPQQFRLGCLDDPGSASLDTTCCLDGVTVDAARGMRIVIGPLLAAEMERLREEGWCRKGNRTWAATPKLLALVGCLVPVWIVVEVELQEVEPDRPSACVLDRSRLDKDGSEARLV